MVGMERVDLGGGCGQERLLNLWSGGGGGGGEVKVHEGISSRLLPRHDAGVWCLLRVLNPQSQVSRNFHSIALPKVGFELLFIWVLHLDFSTWENF